MIIAAVIILGVAAAGAVAIGGKLSSGEAAFVDPGSQSQQAQSSLNDAAKARIEPDIIVLMRFAGNVRSNSAAAQVNHVAVLLSHDPDVVSVETNSSPGSPSSMISRDGKSTYLLVLLRRISDQQAEEVVKRLRTRLAGISNVAFGGLATTSLESQEQIQSDLRRAEIIALPIVLIVAYLVFGSLVAALLPVLIGVTGIALTLFGLQAINTIAPLSAYALNLASGLGLALAVDYTILLVMRFREELASHDKATAVQNTLNTAGRAIAFSSFLIGLASASLLVFPERFLYSMGVAGVLVAAATATAALIFLPAVLALLGTHIDSGQLPGLRKTGDRQGALWLKLANTVMRHPVLVAVSSAAVLLACGLPFISVKFIHDDARALPAATSAHKVQSVLSREFTVDPAAPIEMVTTAPVGAAPAIERWAKRLSHIHGVTEVAEPSYLEPHTWSTTVTTSYSPTSSQAESLVRRLRQNRAPYPTTIGGEIASYVDQNASIARSGPLALGILAITTLVMLFCLTGSVILPIKTFVLNLCTISAAFGLLVVVFQSGRLTSLLGIPRQGGLEITQPVLIFVVAFGLSTDYGVFLITRIQEAYREGFDTRAAIAIGLQRSGRTVTTAALLLAVAVGAFFATSSIVFVEEIGFGIGFAVLIDAFIVRAFLFPSLMALLGDWNWWAPPFLRRIWVRFASRQTVQQPQRDHATPHVYEQPLTEQSDV